MKTPRAKARGFMLMKMIILRFAPGTIHPQAEAWGLLAFSINLIRFCCFFTSVRIPYSMC